jgi:response regulator NasT
MTALRIAVADDEPQVREYFKRILPRLGHEVVSAAANGRELLEQCRALRPEVVITDINMPELSGLEAARSIWEELGIPAIFVSAHHDSAIPPGSDRVIAHLVKPVKRADLESAIKHLVEASHRK